MNRTHPSDDALRAAWRAEIVAARSARVRHDRIEEWHHLERAHTISQPAAGRHVRTHLAMLGRSPARRWARRNAVRLVPAVRSVMASRR